LRDPVKQEFCITKFAFTWLNQERVSATWVHLSCEVPLSGTQKEIPPIKTMDTKLVKQNIITFLRNEPLIIKDESINRFDSDIITRESSIFAGIGLCTDHEVTAGVPFDVLGIILTAEKLRRKLAMKRIILQIADNHAQSNNLIPADELTNVAVSVKFTIQKILDELDLIHISLFLSSQIGKTDFEELEKMQTQNNYLKS